jgi:hypothetical protein
LGGFAVGGYAPGTVSKLPSTRFARVVAGGDEIDGPATSVLLAAVDPD